MRKLLRPGTVMIAALAVALTGCTTTTTSGGGGGGGGGGATTQGVTDTEVYIQGFGPLTGPASWVGLGNRDGFALAIKEINAAGGVHGRQLRFEFEDDGFEVAQAQQVTRRIIQQDKPFMVYAGTGSTVFLAVADQLRQSGLPIYNGFSGSEAARKTPEVDTMFHGEAVSTKWVAPSIADMAVDQLKATRVALIREDGEWGRTLCAGVAEALATKQGVEIVADEQYPAAGTDFSGQLVTLRNANPQIVVNCGLFPAAKIILRQARELGLDAQFIGDAGQANETVWSGNEAAAENWLFNWYEPQYLTDTTGAQGEFRTKYAAEYPQAPAGRPNHADNFSYTAAYLLRDALEKAGRDLTADKFLAAMNEASNVKPTPISPNIDCANDRNECFVDLNWMRVSGGKAVPADEAGLAEIASNVAAS